MISYQERFERELRESLGETNVDDGSKGTIERNVAEQEMFVWTKVVGDPTKGRIYGLKSEVSAIARNVPMSNAMHSSTSIYVITIDAEMQAKVVSLEKEVQEMRP